MKRNHWDNYSDDNINICDDVLTVLKKESDIDIMNQTEELWKAVVQVNGLLLQHIKEQTQEICLLAVEQNPLAFIYVDEQFKTNELCSLAVTHNGKILKYIDNQTKEMCYLAVQQYPYAIQYVNKEYLTEELCILAVTQNGYALKYIQGSFQTEAVRKEALQQNEEAYQFIESKNINA